MESMARDRSQVTYHIVPVVLQRLRFSHGPWTPRSFLLLCFERRQGHGCWEFGSGRHELWKA